METYSNWFDGISSHINFETRVLTLLHTDDSLGKSCFAQCIHREISLSPEIIDAVKTADPGYDIIVRLILKHDEVALYFDTEEVFEDGMVGKITICHRLETGKKGEYGYRCPVCGHGEFLTFPAICYPTDNTGALTGDPVPVIDHETPTTCVKCEFRGERMAFSTLTWDNFDKAYWSRPSGIILDAIAI